MHEGAIYTYDAHYQDIVPGQRIAYTYIMDRDETRISISVTTVEFKPAGAGTRLIYTEQGAFLEKVAREHAGKMLLLSGPIVDYTHYFSHRRLMLEFKSLGFSLVKSSNLSVYWHPPSNRIVANLVKVPLGYTVLDWLPEEMIYQRLYVLRAPKRY